ncbi:MAG TPA: LysR family transcriptional regulator [Caulobacteraceae bacterium]
MLDDLNELRTFQRILALGSLSAAGRDLGVGLAVVSKRLGALERRVGARLVNRTTRRLSATGEGQALLVHVERMLEELGEAEARLSSGQEAPRGVLRISAPIAFGRIHVAPVVADLVARYDGLEADLKLDDRLIDLIEARIDVAVRIGAPRDSTAVMRKLADNRRILAASPAYLDRAGRPRMPEETAGHAFLRYDSGDAPWRLERPGGVVAEIEAPCRLRADSGNVVNDWALAGHGIMLRSQADVAAELTDGRLEQVLPDWQSGPAPIYALFPSARHVATKVRVFLDALAARLAEI